MNKFIHLSKRTVSILAYYLLLSPLMKRTKWYEGLFVEDKYPDNRWYREHYERNYKLVALGSSGAKWALDFDSIGFKAMNWSNSPQTLIEDFNLLRCYHSILEKNGYVLITIMPFTGLDKSTNIYDAIKFLNLETQGEPIQPHLFRKANLLKKYPLLLGKPAIKGLIKYILGHDKRVHPDVAPMVSMLSREMDADASMWVNGWKHQFTISDFEAPLTEENLNGRNRRINIMRRLIDFCRERGYTPVYLIPPVTSHLSAYYTPKFEDLYIYNFLREVDRPVKMLDYSKCDELKQDGLYFNSFFFNKKGRKLFTTRVLRDLELI